MPTASIKAEKEKQPSPDSKDPLQQGITIVEHKIRNLEKRKSKLDGYRVLQTSGKELSKDQATAVERYEEVIQTLEFARDLAKQLNTLSLESAKIAKKQQKKEAQERALFEIARTKELLVIQDVLSNMGQDNVRDDLMGGKCKITLTAEELQQIDDLYQELAPKTEEPATLSYVNQFQSCAEHMTMLIDGKAKEAFGSSYAALKVKLLDIANSGYFDPPQLAESQPQPPQPVAVPVEEVPQEVQPEVVIPAPFVPPQPTTVAGGVVMQEVSQVESALFQAQQEQQQQLQQQQQQAQQTVPPTHHLSVFKTGTIDFIQENEIEEPPEDPNAIPTLTYTNQNYTPTKGGEGGEREEVGDTVVEERGPPEGEWGPSEGEWTSVGGGGDAPRQEDMDKWADNHWQHQQSNDGFIAAGRGGRGRPRGRGGPNRTQQPNRPNNYQPRGGASNGYKREGGYNREGGGGGGGQYYQNQNGYRGGGGGGERRGRGGYGGEQRGGERGGRGSRGGPRGGRGGYRGGNQQ